MGIYKPARQRLVARYKPGGGSGGSMPRPRRICLHTAVTNADSLYSLFATPGNAVAHFYVDQAGNIEQYIDTSRMSSANLDGNHDTISIETWDGYGTGWSGSNVPPWNEKQLDAIAALVAWCAKTHGIPLVKCPSSKPGTAGVAWHRQGVDGNFPDGLLGGRVPGGERWSTAAGKVCPGDNRIQQVQTIIDRAKRGGSKPTKAQRHDIRELRDLRGEVKSKPARKRLTAAIKRLRLGRKGR